MEQQMENQNQLTQKQRKQKRLALGLRIVSVFIAVAASLLFSCLNSFNRVLPFVTSDEAWNLIGGATMQKPVVYEEFVDLMSGHFIISFVSMLLVFYILQGFYQVCNEIGKDNSFSLENVKNFWRMAWASVATAVLYIIKMIVFVARFLEADYPRIAEVLALGYTIAIIMFLLFAYLCRSLSKLVFNAYEMQTENDLTI